MMPMIGYRGIAFPFRFDHAGSVAGSDTFTGRPDHVLESVRQILGARRGERVMRPEFGSDADDLVFSPQSHAFTRLVVHNARKSLARWEPRVEVNRLEAVLLQDEKAVMEVDMTVKVNKEDAHLTAPLGDE